MVYRYVNICACMPLATKHSNLNGISTYVHRMYGILVKWEEAAGTGTSHRPNSTFSQQQRHEKIIENYENKFST